MSHILVLSDIHNTNICPNDSVQSPSSPDWVGPYQVHISWSYSKMYMHMIDDLTLLQPQRPPLSSSQIIKNVKAHSRFLNSQGYIWQPYYSLSVRTWFYFIFPPIYFPFLFSFFLPFLLHILFALLLLPPTPLSARFPLFFSLSTYPSSPCSGLILVRIVVTFPPRTRILPWTSHPPTTCLTTTFLLLWTSFPDLPVPADHRFGSPLLSLS